MTKLKRQNQKIRISIIIVLLASMLFVSSSQALTDNKQMPATSMENLFPAFMNVSDETGSQVASRSYDLDGYKNTIGYNNQDGTKTVYIYSTDVRYRDKNGVLRDKDTSIVSTQDTLKNKVIPTKQRQIILTPISPMPCKTKESRWHINKIVSL